MVEKAKIDLVLFWEAPWWKKSIQTAIREVIRALRHTIGSQRDWLWKIRCASWTFFRQCSCHQIHIYLQDSSAIWPMLSAGSGLWGDRKEDAVFPESLSLLYSHSCVACSMPCLLSNESDCDTCWCRLLEDYYFGRSICAWNSIGKYAPNVHFQFSTVFIALPTHVHTARQKDKCYWINLILFIP